MFRTRSITFAAFVGAFLVFSGIVASGVTAAIDNPVNAYANSIQGNAGLDALMIALTTTGDLATLFVFGIIITVLRRTRKAGMIFLITMVALAIAVMYLKPFVGREIPLYEFSPVLELPENFGIENDSLAPFAAAFSYPSGHASRATALAFIVGYLLYQKSRPAGYAIWAFPIVIGITRVYVQQHFPTDLVGGFLIGVIISTVTSNAMKLWQPFQMSRFKGKEDGAKTASV
jgi:undecaprenyl-diphosphatase